MIDLFSGLDAWVLVSLLLALTFVLAFEFINGFHDTANAVATVIYTKAMPPHLAVFFSGVFNFLGVLLGGVGVAYAIVHLLPVELLINVNTGHGLAMVFSLLAAAIAWNLGTWYFGIPASSSHTLIGSILGVGLANALINDIPLADGVNWQKAIDIGASLVFSPMAGFLVAALVLIGLKWWRPLSKMHKTPDQRRKIDDKKHPPFWNRLVLVISAMAVSFVHGSNDGQKGIGLVMLVLICMAPAYFALDMSSRSYDLDRTQDANQRIMEIYQRNQDQVSHLVNFSVPAKAQEELMSHCAAGEALQAMATLDKRLGQVRTYEEMNLVDRREVRRLLLCIDDTARKVSKLPLPAKELTDLAKWRKDLTATAEYAPTWVIVSIALALA